MSKILTQMVFGYTLIDEWNVERWSVRIEDFCTVFNSTESLASDSLAGEKSYLFTSKSERDKWADAQDQELYEKYHEKYGNLMDSWRDNGVSPGDFFREDI